MIVPTLTITGVDEAIADVTRRLAAMQDGVRQTLDAFGKSASEEMIRTHTFQNRTYRLENSIGYHVADFPEGHFTLGLFASAPYATQVEFGHPGPPPARPYPFFWPVYYEMEPQLWNQLEVTVHTALGES